MSTNKLTPISPIPIARIIKPPKESKKFHVKALTEALKKLPKFERF